MKRITTNLLGVLVFVSVLNLQLRSALAQATAFTSLTITNPTPEANDFFGWCAAAVGTDRILIGAFGDDTGATDAGAAYLFSINGTLLQSFTNPTPANGDFFGFSVAALGTNRVVIGARFDDTGATDAGVAYLFSTDGALLTTFTNPTPAEGDSFGASVAAVGADRVLIGAFFPGTTNAGAAFLFSTNGALLTTFTNPTPATDDLFGCFVTVVGADQVLIGAHGDDIGAGKMYLFAPTMQTLGAPRLTIKLTSTNTMTVSWPSPSTDWALQENTDSVASVSWSNAPGTIQDNGTIKYLIVNPPPGNRFYRLFKPGG